MAKLDRFGGPESWDLHCYKQDMMYDRLIEGRTCFECAECIVCDVAGHEEVGYCKYLEDWVTSDDTPKSVECEGFNI